MGRRRKNGLKIDGWINLNKPAGITSTQALAKVRRALNAQKAGHAGTLDPLASGVLPIALGEATKTVNYAQDALKTYRFTAVWGQQRSTDDREGGVIETSDKRPSKEEIEALLPGFIGDIEQLPPQFSAVKVDGERAYALARAGEEMDLAARPLWVESLDLAARPDADTVELEMVCGKGGYVRSIARDLGQALGCLGHVLWLRREWSGPFEAADGVSIELIDAEAKTGALDSRLLPLEVGLADLPELKATPEGAARLRNGNPGMVFASDVEWGEEAWASYQGRAVAVGVYKSGELHPNRVFNL